jgi:hypothetical protein
VTGERFPKRVILRRIIVTIDRARFLIYGHRCSAFLKSGHHPG